MFTINYSKPVQHVNMLLFEILGAITCISSLASSISRNMDFLSLDDEHLARQELLRHHLPHGVSEGLIQGLSGLGLSLLSKCFLLLL